MWITRKKENEIKMSEMWTEKRSIDNKCRMWGKIYIMCDENVFGMIGSYPANIVKSERDILINKKDNFSPNRIWNVKFIIESILQLKKWN
jgi:hypothetical protein